MRYVAYKAVLQQSLWGFRVAVRLTDVFVF